MQELSGNELEQAIRTKLCVRARKVLLRLGLESVGEIANFSEDDFLGMKNCGPVTLEEIRGFARRYDVFLRNENKTENLQASQVADSINGLADAIRLLADAIRGKNDNAHSSDMPDLQAEAVPTVPSDLPASSPGTHQPRDRDALLEGDVARRKRCRSLGA